MEEQGAADVLQQSSKDALPQALGEPAQEAALVTPQQPTVEAETESEDMDEEVPAKPDEFASAAKASAALEPETTTGQVGGAAQDLQFPFSRVKRLIKNILEGRNSSMEASFLIAKSAELFLDRLVEKLAEHQRHKDLVSYSDLAETVKAYGTPMEFLADIVPVKTYYMPDNGHTTQASDANASDAPVAETIQETEQTALPGE
mmetsp:Transcript_5419/g.19824  ORF Transcript_5419/g.19824 Transcript_5419/m.19824 type:complete len:203 (-) Transcript_5419:2770-3378(-)